MKSVKKDSPLRGMSESIGDLTMVNGLMFVITVERVSCYQMCYKSIFANVRKTIHLCLEVYLEVYLELYLEVYLEVYLVHWVLL